MIGTHKLLQSDVRFKGLGSSSSTRSTASASSTRSAEETARRGRHAHADGDADPAHAQHDARRPARPFDHRDAARGSALGEDLRRRVDRPRRSARPCSARSAAAGKIYFVHNRVENIEAIGRADLRKLLAGSRRFASRMAKCRSASSSIVMLDFYHRRFNVLVCTHDHRERHRHPDRKHDHHQPRRSLGPRAAAPAARPRRPLASPSVRVSRRPAAARVVRRRREAPRSDRSLSRSSALDSRSRRTISKFAAPASCSARNRAARFRRSVSRSITSCSRAPCARFATGREPDLEDPFTHGPEIEIGVAALIPEDYMPDVHMRLVHYKRIANAATRERSRGAAGRDDRSIRLAAAAAQDPVRGDMDQAARARARYREGPSRRQRRHRALRASARASIPRSSSL